MSEKLIITGNENTGKSTLCKKMVVFARSLGIMVTGILSELEVDGKKNIAINSIDLRTGEKIKLADYSPGWDVISPERKWKFNGDAFEWGNFVLTKSIPTELLIIDEIGYQELENRMGWNACFSILLSQNFKLSILVIRPELINKAKQIWEIAAIFKLKGFGQDYGVEQNLQKYIKSVKE
jgi:nucleoside-triphosphatase THEP1